MPIAGEKWSKRHNRMLKANDFLHCIASCGHRFFRHRGIGSFSHFWLNANGRIWWQDAHSGVAVNVHTSESAGWHGFTNGSTLRYLVRHLRDYIMGKPFKADLGPWPDSYCRGDLWGYGADMEQVREAAKLLV